MTRKESLISLRDTVKAGGVIRAIDARALWPGIGVWGEVCRASQGSLDAAKAMHEAVLPGWHYSLYDDNGIGFSETQIERDDWQGEPFSGKDKSPARAWLLAILEALIAQEPDE